MKTADTKETKMHSTFSRAAVHPYLQKEKDVPHGKALVEIGGWEGEGKCLATS